MTEKIETGEALEVVHATPSNIVRMSVTVDEFKKSLIEYQALKSAIITPDDKQKIGDKEFLKKSYWRKVNNAFNLSVRVVKEERIDLDNGNIIWDFTCEAMANNGRTSCGVGSCSIYEKAVFIEGKFMMPVKEWMKSKSGKSYKGDKKDKDGNIVYEPATPNSWHNARSTAETRAYNRCVSNLVGGGEVSAEEVDRGREEDFIDEPREAIKPHETKKPEAKTEVKKDIKEDINAKPSNDEQTETIKVLLELQKDKVAVDAWICKAYKVDYYQQLTYDQAEKVIKYLQEGAEKYKKEQETEPNDPAEDQGHADTKTTKPAKKGKAISEAQKKFINNLAQHYHENINKKMAMLLLAENAGSVDDLDSWGASNIIKKIEADIEKDNKAKEQKA